MAKERADAAEREREHRRDRKRDRDNTGFAGMDAEDGLHDLNVRLLSLEHTVRSLSREDAMYKDVVGDTQEDEIAGGVFVSREVDGKTTPQERPK